MTLMIILTLLAAAATVAIAFSKRADHSQRAAMLPIPIKPQKAKHPRR